MAKQADLPSSRMPDAPSKSAGRNTYETKTDADPQLTIVDAVRFTNEHARTPEPVCGTLQTLLGPHVGRSSKSGPAISFAHYAQGATRGRTGVDALTAIVFDFDHLSAPTARSVVQRVHQRQLAYHLYSSFSHRLGGRDDCCFRLILLPSRPVTSLEYPTVWQTVDQWLGGQADRKARDVARIWFTPACPTEGLSRAIVDNRAGQTVCIDEVLAQVAMRQSTSPQRSSAPTPITLRPGLARRAAQHRLNNDPFVRTRAAQQLQACITETRATRIQCPRCGRASVWFWLSPTSKRTASCNHRKTCGWFGFLDTLLTFAGGH